MSSINYGLLFEQGRCYAIGIPWTEEQANAIYTLKIPVDYVRQGCLTQEDYLKAVGNREVTEKKTGKVALIHLTREQLVALCGKYGIPVTDEAIRPTIINVLLENGCPKSVSLEEI